MDAACRARARGPRQLVAGHAGIPRHRDDRLAVPARRARPIQPGSAPQCDHPVGSRAPRPQPARRPGHRRRLHGFHPGHCAAARIDRAAAGGRRRAARARQAYGRAQLGGDRQPRTPAIGLRPSADRPEEAARPLRCRPRRCRGDRDPCKGAFRTHRPCQRGAASGRDDGRLGRPFADCRLKRVRRGHARGGGERARGSRRDRGGVAPRHRRWQERGAGHRRSRSCGARRGGAEPVRHRGRRFGRHASGAHASRLSPEADAAGDLPARRSRDAGRAAETSAASCRAGTVACACGGRNRRSRRATRGDGTSRHRDDARRLRNAACRDRGRSAQTVLVEPYLRGKARRCPRAARRRRGRDSRALHGAIRFPVRRGIGAPVGGGAGGVGQRRTGLRRRTLPRRCRRGTRGVPAQPRRRDRGHRPRCP